MRAVVVSLTSTLLCACTLGNAASARAESKRWQSYVQAPAHAVQTPVRVLSTEGEVENADALVNGDGAATLIYKPYAEPPAVVLDFGREIGGFPTFGVHAFSGDTALRSSYSETLAGLSQDGDYAGRTRLVRVQEQPLRKEGTLKSARIEGGQRYVRLTLSAPGTVSLSSAGITFSAFRGTPKALRGSFLSSDRLLNRIWYAGVYTVNLSQIVPGLRQLPGQLAEKPVLVDGAKRDRRIWSGDLLMAAPTVYYALDPRYVRGSLEIIGANPATDGRLFVRARGELSEPGPLPGVCSPNTQGGNGCRFYSAAYSMAFVIALYDYYRYTGDLGFVEKQWPAVVRQMEWNTQHIGEDGLYTVDEATGATWNLESFSGELTYVNAVYVEALDAAARLSLALHKQQAKLFVGRARRIAEAVNAHLFNPASGTYDVSTTLRGPVTQDANVYAVLSEIAPPEQAVRIMTTLETALANPRGMRNVSLPDPEGFRPVVSPYMGGFHLQAEFETGRTDAALDLIRREWGWMVDHDPGGTAWERILTDGRLTHRASAAHAWSTGATSALSHYVLGAAPVEAGWDTWEVMPHPGDIAWTRGSVPTPHGRLRVRWRQRTRPLSFALAVRAPKGTHGSVWVPRLGARRVLKRDGQRVKAHRDGDYAVVRGHTGAHSYTWTAPRKKHRPRRHKSLP